MALTVAEANAVNRLLDVVLQLEDEQHDEHTRNALDRDAAVFLAERAHRTLMAGLDGTSVARAWNVLRAGGEL